MNCDRAFLLVGVARSGTTSLTRLLDTASNSCCVVEPYPNLNVETRLMMEGRLEGVHGVLSRTVIQRIREQLMFNKGVVYGEKDVTYAPFITHIFQEQPCQFVFIHRDGRDVVRSLINWHDQKFGTVYRECRETGNLNSTSILSAANLPIALDSSDYSRPRPALGTPLDLEWPNLTRAEMCAYYWATVNELYLEQFAKIPQDAWIDIDYTCPNPEAVMNVANFLGLKGLESDVVSEMLAGRINSLKDRGQSEENGYPKWTEWDGGMRRRFDRFAAGAMARMGYYRVQAERWRPAGYGEVWKLQTADIAWYEWMYDGRRRMHEDMLSWIESLEPCDHIGSITDFGCGRGVGYSEAFREKRYIGVDISQENIHWCQENRCVSQHSYICADFITEAMPEKTDLVFSSGTIDNCYDIDEYLAAMVRNAKKWIYLTCYRGWFPDLPEHVYRYNSEQCCFYNDVSLPRVLKRLRELGCFDISAVPLRTGNPDIPFETRIIARVANDGF